MLTNAGLDLMDPSKLYDVSINKMEKEVKIRILESNEFRNYKEGLEGKFEEDGLIAAFLFTEDYINSLGLKFYIMIDQREDHVPHYRDNLGYAIIGTSMDMEVYEASGEYSSLAGWAERNDGLYGSNKVSINLGNSKLNDYLFGSNDAEVNYDIEIVGKFTDHAKPSVREENQIK